MPLSDKQRALAIEEAKRRGIDEAALIAEMERLADEKPDAKSDDAKGKPPSGEPPKLFMYHLPFVRVREVRQVWLGLTESFPGDDEIASEWAAKHGADAAPAGTPPPDEAA